MNKLYKIIALRTFMVLVMVTPNFSLARNVSIGSGLRTIESDSRKQSMDQNSAESELKFAVSALKMAASKKNLEEARASLKDRLGPNSKVNLNYFSQKVYTGLRETKFKLLSSNMLEIQFGSAKTQFEVVDKWSGEFRINGHKLNLSSFTNHEDLLSAINRLVQTAKDSHAVFSRLLLPQAKASTAAGIALLGSVVYFIQGMVGTDVNDKSACDIRRTDSTYSQLASVIKKQIDICQTEAPFISRNPRAFIGSHTESYFSGKVNRDYIILEGKLVKANCDKIKEMLEWRNGWALYLTKSTCKNSLCPQAEDLAACLNRSKGFYENGHDNKSHDDDVDDGNRL